MPRFAFVFALLLAWSTLCAQPGDKPGSQDHPAVSRFKGAFIMSYAHKRYDAYRLATGPVSQAPFDTPAAYEDVAGEQTLIIYRNPKTASAYEVMANYASALQQAGFELRYACEGSTCGRMKDYLLRYLPNALVGSWDKNQRYLAYRGSAVMGELYIALYTAETADGPYTLLHITEATGMETGQVSARQLGDDIDTRGRAVLYALYFDTGRAGLLPTSEPALAAIAGLLRERPTLACHVVGHTDNVGSFGSNLDLSQRRAAAVVSALTTRYGIDASRLTAHGVASLAPVATNDTDTGRSRNRRVELVRQ
ncbi:MAG: OmpA family protein [Bacteroidia bacterium]